MEVSSHSTNPAQIIQSHDQFECRRLKLARMYWSRYAMVRVCRSFKFGEKKKAELAAIVQASSEALEHD